MSEVICPKCGSNQISAHKKGFSGKKAVAGALVTGGIGILAGTIGSNKIMITCLSCGNKFRPGNGRTVDSQAEPPHNTVPYNPTNLLIIGVPLSVISFVLLAYQHYFFGVIIAALSAFFLIGYGSQKKSALTSQKNPSDVLVPLDSLHKYIEGACMDEDSFNRMEEATLNGKTAVYINKDKLKEMGNKYNAQNNRRLM